MELIKRNSTWPCSLLSAIETKNVANKQFWGALDIFATRPHIVNRRIIGAETLGYICVDTEERMCHLKQIVSQSKGLEDLMDSLRKEDGFSISAPNKQPIVLACVKQLLPKLKTHQIDIQLVINDYHKTEVIFLNSPFNINLVPNFMYAISYNEGVLKAWIENYIQETDSSCQWIATKVMPKLLKWMCEDFNVSPKCSSLSLVKVSEYCTMYNRLKEVYGKELVKIWPENTDPLKFVYEDVAIASYLLLLWADKPKQRFVDLGCGNGLLVHILNSEGHLGVGYDLRARKIWTMYPASTKLEVRTIIPSSETLFPSADWLIGNHSDELTVWLPVMAAHSSYTCSIFLLPCCPYDFDGSKFCRINTSVSHYADFLSYVEKVCVESGFVTKKDKLRIPSTKRICFVGSSRTYSECDYKSNLGKIQELVNMKCGVHHNEVSKNEGVWCPQFKPRGDEKVRNCTRIDSSVKESIVNLVVEHLLAKRRGSLDSWNYGGAVEVGTLAKIIPQDSLNKLKSECGGLQTLLKNHHQIFKVQGGNVEFRIPIEKLKSDSIVWKTKPCWFFNNHPNLCPLPDEKCSFVHKA